MALVLVFSAALVVSACIRGGEPEIVVKGATIISSVMMEGAASSFMFIINDGKGSDKLTGCSIKEFPSVRGEIHDIVGGKMTKMEL